MVGPGGSAINLAYTVLLHNSSALLKRGWESSLYCNMSLSIFLFGNLLSEHAIKGREVSANSLGDELDSGGVR
jgi:hypothetical protein